MKDVVARLLEQDAGGPAGAEGTPRHAQLLPLLRASPTLVQALHRVRCLASGSPVEFLMKMPFGYMRHVSAVQASVKALCLSWAKGRAAPIVCY